MLLELVRKQTFEERTFEFSMSDHPLWIEERDRASVMQASVLTF